MRAWRTMVAVSTTVTVFVACGSSGPATQFDADAGASELAQSDASTSNPGPLSASDSSADAAACDPPDLLVVLDRTLSMSKTPAGMKVDDTDAGRATTKWALAVDALDSLVAPPRDSTVRFGLELFPENPQADGGSAECPTLPELLGGQNATNPTCGAGQLVLPPTLASGPAIIASISQDTTPLCVSTPIGAAMQTAADALAASKVGTRGQYAILITDGGETCSVDAVPIVQSLAAKGIETFVIGFGQDGDGGDKGVRVPLLNDLACAGMTASGFATSCVSDTTDAGTGYVASPSTTAPVFFAAQDGAALASALGEISAQVCCNCPR